MDTAQWNAQYRAPAQVQDDDDGLLLAQPYDDVMETRPREDMVGNPYVIFIARLRKIK